MIATKTDVVEEKEIWAAYMAKYDFGPPPDLYDFDAFSKEYREKKNDPSQTKTA